MNKELELEEEKFDFSSVYTDNFPKILKLLNISLVATSYQSERVIFIRNDEDKIDTNFKVFSRPMGIYVDKERLTLGTFTKVVEFKKNNKILDDIKQGSLDYMEKFSTKVLEKDQEEMDILIEKHQQQIQEIKKADALYLHRAALTTGMINIHDIAWGEEGLWVVNSTFSCLSTLSPNNSFIVRWKPPFISELVPEDRCHLNGMAMQMGKPKYVTTFNKEDSIDSWKREGINNGTLIDIDTNEVLIEGMIMPHSPKVYKGDVYVCESGLGVVWKYDPKTKKKKQIVKLQGFTRGLYIYRGLMFVGLSKARGMNRRMTIPIDEEYEETYSGIWIINLEDYSQIGHIKFEGDVEQIYDIAVIEDSMYPEMIQSDSSLTRHIFDFKEEII